MDKNKDGVVTLEEFVIACQEVCTYVVLQLSCLVLYECIEELMNICKTNLMSKWVNERYSS